MNSSGFQVNIFAKEFAFSWLSQRSEVFWIILLGLIKLQVLHAPISLLMAGDT